MIKEAILRLTPKSIITKFILMISAAFIIIGPIIIQNAMIDQMAKDGISIAEQAVKNLNGYYMNDQHIMFELGENSNIEYALTMDKNFKALTHSNPKRIDMYFKEKGAIATFTGINYTGKYYSPDRKKNIYDVMMPIRNDKGEIIQIFNIGMKLGNMYTIIMSAIIGIVCLAISVIGIVSFYVIFSLKPRLNSLIQWNRDFQSQFKIQKEEIEAETRSIINQINKI